MVFDGLKENDGSFVVGSRDGILDVPKKGALWCGDPIAIDE